MATPLKATYDSNGSFSGLAELQTNDTFEVPRLATFAKAIQETRISLSGNDIDLTTGTVFTKAITSATTFTVTNTPSAGKVSSFILELTNGGAQTITWFTNTKWEYGNKPSLTASGSDILGFYTHDGGTTWNGLVLGYNVK